MQTKPKNRKNPPGSGDFRLSKNLYNEKGRPPYPYQSAKSRDLCVAFCTSQGRGAPLVRWPDGHTFFAFLHRTCPARERSMGAEALRQPLAKTRKSGLSHFFDTLKKKARRPSFFELQGELYYQVQQFREIKRSSYRTLVE